MEITVESAQNMLFTISAFVYSLLILIIFLRKKKVNTLENYIYGFTMSCVVIQLLTSLFCFNVNIAWISLLLRRIHHSLFIIWGCALTLYFIVTVSKENQGYVAFKDNPKKGYFIKIMRIYIPIALVLASLIFILPYESVDGLYITAKGPASTYGYAVFGALIVFWFVLFFMAKNKAAKKQFIPVAICIILVAFFTALQIFLPNLRVTTSVAALAVSFIFW